MNHELKTYFIIVKFPIIHITCKCRCKFDGQKFNINQKGNNDKCQCECNNPIKYHVCKED